MTGLPPPPLLARALGRLLPVRDPAPEFVPQPLPSSRPVFRLDLAETAAVVGKFFRGDPAGAAADRGLRREYANYLLAAGLGLDGGGGLLPRLLGRDDSARLGLLLEFVPGPDLDALLARACHQGEAAALEHGLEKLANLLAAFHTRPVPPAPASPETGLNYLDKLHSQLDSEGLLDPEAARALARERAAWEPRLHQFPDRRVVVHGDATPTNFLFPDGRAVALDLERLHLGDRLLDLSWVAGELKHAWAWRTGDFWGAEAFIGRLFAAYLAALPPDPPLARRLYTLNPFYMALAELRIARNRYLSREHRRALVAEALRCLAGGRRVCL